ncbi:MAG: PIN domain-containing protein [Nanoarchaeota archaeon]|nr:PIN domain-containing protein [Nanoarchaeota archaeon]
MKVVFDTYAWIEYFLGSKKGLKVKEFLERGDEIITPSIVLLEMSVKSNKEGWNFEKQLKFIKMNSKVSGFNDEFVSSFGKIYNKTKKSIKGIGIVDCIVLTTAVLADAKILTGDKHFEKIDRAVLL